LDGFVLGLKTTWLSDGLDGFVLGLKQHVAQWRLVVSDDYNINIISY